MNLAICLVTRGRQQYLDQILRSFESALRDQDVRVHLIDNGSDSVCKEKLIKWQNANFESVTLHRLEQNDPRYSTLWPLIIGTGADWILMPGDDDEFRSEILAEFKSAVAENPKLVAFAASAAVMDANGIHLGETLTASISYSDSQIERLASAFHEPAFVWPSLFFRASIIDPKVPSSRYAFDWWAGINLLIAGDVMTSPSIGLNYRAHLGQESNLAPHRRKYFEGSLWLDSLVRSERFSVWVGTLADSEILNFWRLVLQRQPIYGDAYFAHPILSSLARLLMDSSKSPETAIEIAGELALLAGVFMKDGEAITLVNNPTPISSPSPGNIHADPNLGVCNTIRKACELIRGSDLAKQFFISCSHSEKTSESIYIDCRMLDPQVSSDQTADRIISEITQFCEDRGDYEMAISNGERLVLRLIRNVKAKLPGHIKVYLRRLKNSRN